MGQNNNHNSKFYNNSNYPQTPRSTQSPNNSMNPEVNEMSGQENKEFLGLRLPRISSFRWFNKKPKLRDEPEVIELGPPREHENTSTSSMHVGGEHDNTVQEVSQEQNSLVLDTHIAVLYDRYLNFKERISNRIRNRIMAFMQDDLENRANQDEMDIEGGYSDIPTDSTYDGLVLILTIVLGFVLRLPSMWLLGCILFSLYGNYKRKILKWGFINIVLTMISISYVVYMWNYSDPDIFSIKLPLRSVLMSKTHHIKGEEGTLKYQGKDALLVKIEGNKDLKWTLIHKDTQHNLKHGNFSDKLLIDSKLIPKGTDMIRLNNEFVVKGLVLITVKFKTNHLTPKQSFEKPKSHHYPLHHKPSDTPFDLSFECYPIHSNEIGVVDDQKHFDHNDLSTENIGNTEDGLQNPNDEHLPVPVNNDSKDEAIRKLDEDDYNLYRSYNYNNNNQNKENPDTDNDETTTNYKDMQNKENNKEEKNEENKTESDESSVRKEVDVSNTDKENGDKMYLGVDAIVNEENISRIFNLRKLCKCSLVYVPKKDMDIITASIKRID